MLAFAHTIGRSRGRARTNLARTPPVRCSLANQRICTCHAISWKHALEGEWSGTSASFSLQGKPLPLPDSYVPQEYRQWGIDLKDWATLSSISCTESQPVSAAPGTAAAGQLYLQTRFMLPTVGCEADATSFVEDKRSYAVMSLSEANDASDESIDTSSSAPASVPSNAPAAQDAETGAKEWVADTMGLLFVNGRNFFAGPRALPATGMVLLEAGFSAGMGRRVRLRLPLRKWSASGSWKGEKLEVMQEEYSGPYVGGRELPMSCGPECGFSGDVAVEEAAAACMAAAADVVDFGEAWLEEVLKGRAFVKLPCGTAARFSLEGDRIGLQVATHSTGSGEATPTGDECEGPSQASPRDARQGNDVAIVTIGLTQAGIVGRVDTASMVDP